MASGWNRLVQSILIVRLRRPLRSLSLKSCRSGVCLPGPIPALQSHPTCSNSGTVAAGPSWAPTPAPPLPVSSTSENHVISDLGFLACKMGLKSLPSCRGGENETRSWKDCSRPTSFPQSDDQVAREGSKVFKKLQQTTCSVAPFPWDVQKGRQKVGEWLSGVEWGGEGRRRSEAKVKEIGR